jgi:hypothetical protein
LIETTVDARFAAVFPIDYVPCSAETAAMVRGPSRIFFADLDHSDDARIETGAKHWRYVPRFA